MKDGDWQYYLTHVQFMPEGGSIVKQLEACWGCQTSLPLFSLGPTEIKTSPQSCLCSPACPPPLLPSSLFQLPPYWVYREWARRNGTMAEGVNTGFFLYPQNRISLLNMTLIVLSVFLKKSLGGKTWIMGELRAIFSVSEKLWLGKMSTAYAGITMDSVINLIISCWAKARVDSFKCLSRSREILFLDKFCQAIKLFQNLGTLINT